MSLAFEPAGARLALPELNWHAAQTAGPDLTPYLDYYGINFRSEFPQLAHTLGWFEAARERIAGQVFALPEADGTVFILHGYYDHLGLYSHLIRWCLQRNLSVVGWDLPGHGLSTGPRASIDSFGDYVEVLQAALGHAQQALPQPFHIFGQSTGGAITMDFLLGGGFRHNNSPFQQVVLLAPLVRPARWRQARIAFHLLSPFLRQTRRSFARNSSDEAFLHFLKNEDPLQQHTLPTQWVRAMREWMGRMLEFPPTDLSPMVIQGEQDGTVDWRFNLPVICEKFRDPEVLMLPNGKHHLANESETIRRQYLSALERRFGFC